METRTTVLIAMGAALAGGLIVQALQPTPEPVAVSDRGSVSAPVIEDTAPNRPQTDRPVAAPVIEVPAAQPSPGFQVAPKSPERLRREAVIAQIRSRQWRAENGTDEERQQAKRSLADQ